MRRRIKIDLGQKISSPKEEARINRKRQRWAEVNKDRPVEENPYLLAIRPDNEQFGDEDEKGDELKQRLNNLEYGNFPGYFKYRTKAAVENKQNNRNQNNDKEPIESEHNSKDLQEKTTSKESKNSQENPISITNELELVDERLKHFQKQWFENKDVLDIGCNRGHIVYAIARMFSPNLIVGIDIDLKMIQMANKDLHLHLENGLISESNELRRRRAAKLKLDEIGNGTYIEDCNHFPLSSYIRQGPIALVKKQQESHNGNEEDEESIATVEKVIATPIAESSGCQREEKGEIIVDSGDDIKQTTHVKDQNKRKSPIDKNQEQSDKLSLFEGKFPNNIVFLEHNYVLSKDELVDKQKEQFDVIVCLSVTKWVHLNYRDLGLKRFFKRVYKHLRANGLFILEAQPFDNYGRRKKLSDRLRANYYSIEFKPEQFDDFLLSAEIGFKKIIYQTITEHECEGFKRPIKVFMK